MKPQPQLDAQHPGYSFVIDQDNLIASTTSITKQLMFAEKEIQSHDNLDSLAIELVHELASKYQRNRWRGKNYIQSYLSPEEYADVITAK